MANMDDVYMGTAFLYARKSKAVRAQVGAVLVTETGILLPGINGTAAGTDNRCEDENGLTKIETIHAELNCLIKAAKEGVSVHGATVYVTMSPCRHCAALMIQSGIKRVVYSEQYRDASGIEYLINNGVEVDCFFNAYPGQL
jgi:dCMP deaminase